MPFALVGGKMMIEHFARNTVTPINPMIAAVILCAKHPTENPLGCASTKALVLLGLIARKMIFLNVAQVFASVHPITAMNAIAHNLVISLIKTAQLAIAVN
jgi:hypothetical protein